MNLDDFDTPMKNWRNKHPNDLENNFEPNFNDKSDANGNRDGNRGGGGGEESNGVPFAQNIDQHVETFSASIYILVVLTIIVMLLFFNWYTKGRHILRARRKYFILNRLGF